MRSIIQIQEDIEKENKRHREAMIGYAEEIEEFRDACPHPKGLQKFKSKNYEDEYGSTIGTYFTTYCLACGYEETRDVSQHEKDKFGLDGKKSFYPRIEKMETS